MDGFRSWALLCGLVALGSASCDGLGHACTEFGCLDGVSATLQPQVGRRGGDYSRDGAVVLEDSRALVYQDSYPNGEDCPAACRQAQLVLELDE